MTNFEEQNAGLKSEIETLKNKIEELEKDNKLLEECIFVYKSLLSLAQPKMEDEEDEEAN